MLDLIELAPETLMQIHPRCSNHMYIIYIYIYIIYIILLARGWLKPKSLSHPKEPVSMEYRLRIPEAIRRRSPRRRAQHPASQH